MLFRYSHFLLLIKYFQYFLHAFKNCHEPLSNNIWLETFLLGQFEKIISCQFLLPFEECYSTNYAWNEVILLPHLYKNIKRNFASTGFCLQCWRPTWMPVRVLTVPLRSGSFLVAGKAMEDGSNPWALEATVGDLNGNPGFWLCTHPLQAFGEWISGWSLSLFLSLPISSSVNLPLQ